MIKSMKGTNGGIRALLPAFLGTLMLAGKACAADAAKPQWAPFDPFVYALSSPGATTLLTALIAGAVLGFGLLFWKLLVRLEEENRLREVSDAALQEESRRHERMAKNITAIANMGLRLSAVRGPREAAEIIMDTADHLFGWHACKLDLYANDKHRVWQILVMDTVDGKRVEFPPPDEQYPTPLTQKIIDEGAKLVLRDSHTTLPEAIPFGNQERLSASLMFVPIRYGSSVCGVATIQSYSPNAYHQEDLEAFQALADHCGGAIERLRAQEERETLIQQLQGALTQVKTLSGLLPICAWCKKIRDDGGYWKQVETYIRERSDADFTHCICPECAKQLSAQQQADKA